MYPVRARALGLPTASPKIEIDPEFGTTRPTTHRIKVVLPAPFGPRSPRISASFTSSETPDSAERDPYDFTSDSILSGIIGWSIAVPRGRTSLLAAIDSRRAVLHSLPVGSGGDGRPAPTPSRGLP